MRNVQEFEEHQVDLFNAWHVSVLENLQKHSCFRIVRSSRLWPGGLSSSGAGTISEHLRDGCTERRHQCYWCSYSSPKSDNVSRHLKRSFRVVETVVGTAKDQDHDQPEVVVDLNNDNNGYDVSGRGGPVFGVDALEALMAAAAAAAGSNPAAVVADDEVGRPDGTKAQDDDVVVVEVGSGPGAMASAATAGTVVRFEAFSCVSCHQDFPSECLLGQHNKTVHKNREKSFLCREGDCGFRCNSRSEYNRHVYHHTNLVSFRCDVCGNFPLQATRMDNITRHVRNHLKPFDQDSPEYRRVRQLNEEVLGQARLWVPRVKRCFWLTANFHNENLTDEDLKKLSYWEDKIVILMKADSMTDDDRRMLMQMSSRKKKHKAATAAAALAVRKPNKRKSSSTCGRSSSSACAPEDLEEPVSPPRSNAANVLVSTMTASSDLLQQPSALVVPGGQRLPLEPVAVLNFLGGGGGGGLYPLPVFDGGDCGFSSCAAQDLHFLDPNTRSCLMAVGPGANGGGGGSLIQPYATAAVGAGADVEDDDNDDDPLNCWSAGGLDMVAGGFHNVKDSCRRYTATINGPSSSEEDPNFDQQLQVDGGPNRTTAAQFQSWNYESFTGAVEEFLRPPTAAASNADMSLSSTVESVGSSGAAATRIGENSLFSQEGLGVACEDFDICRYIDAEACALGVFSNVAMDEAVVANPNSILPESDEFDPREEQQQHPTPPMMTSSTPIKIELLNYDSGMEPSPEFATNTSHTPGSTAFEEKFDSWINDERPTTTTMTTKLEFEDHRRHHLVEAADLP